MTPSPAHLTQVILDRYFANALTPKELVEVDGHLSACEECRERVLDSEEVFVAYGLFVEPEPDVAGYGAGPVRLSLAGSEARDTWHPDADLLVAAADDRLPPSQQASLDDHLALCARCAAEAQELQEFRAAIGS